MDNENTSAIDFIKAYEEKGYNKSYRVVEGKLIENETKNEFTENEITIVAKHRFEGMTNPSDMSLLYVVETQKNTKGTILVPYGNSNDTDALMFFNDVPEKNIEQSENIVL